MEHKNFLKMGRKNTNFRKLYLVDENHYNSLQYGQVHDRHLKDVKSLFETLNRPQPTPTQNAPPLQQDQPMNVDSQNNNMPDTSDVSMQSLSNPPNNARGQPQTLQSTQTNNPLPIPSFAHQPQTLQSTQTNNPLGFPGIVQNAHRMPLGSAVSAATIPSLDYGPPLLPRPISGQPNQNDVLQAAGFVGPTQPIPSPQPIVQLAPSPLQPTAANPLQFSGFRQPAASGPSIPALNFGGFAPAITSSPVPAIQPLSQPNSVIQPVRALPAPAAPLPLPVPVGPFAPAPRMEVDPSRGTRRPRSPDTVGDNGSPIIGRPGQRRRYQSVIKPVPLSVPTVVSAPSEPSVSQQVVAPTNILPSTGVRRARSEGDSSSTIDGRTVRRRNDESPIRSRTPQPTVASGSQETGARRRTYQRVLINPDEDFLRQNSRDTQQQRPEIVWFKCSICKNNFRSEQTLRKHQQRVHKEYFEQSERGEKRERGNQEYGRNNPKNKRIA